jgi:hypothetical protein
MRNKTNNPNPVTVGYEPKDANIRWILVFMALVFISCVVVFIAARILLAKFEQHVDQRDAVVAQSQVLPSVAHPDVYFPYPREQPAPREDLQTFQARENGELNSYGWIDRKSGIVRVPIARAMDLVLAKGLPTRDATNQPATGPSSLELQQRRPNTGAKPELEESK